MFRTLSVNFTAVLAMSTALLLASADAARAASVPAVTFTDASFPGDGGSYSLGYEFTPNVNILVTDLGYYDGDGDGLGASSEVGIFDQSTTLLVPGASVTVPSGTGGTLVGNGPDGSYRYQSLTTPVLLTAGTTYRIAGTTGGGANFYAWENYTDFAANPNIAVGSGYYAGSASLAYPSTLSPYAGSPIFAGGNFLFELPVAPPPVPEPASMLLLLSGGVLAMVHRQRRSRR